VDVKEEICSRDERTGWRTKAIVWLSQKADKSSKMKVDGRVG